MKFWDSSALIPLLAVEDASETVRSFISADPSVVVSFITPVEVESAIWRKSRSTRDDVARERSHRRLAALRTEWVVVDGYADVLAEAHRMVGRYDLRGADAIQLASAVVIRAESFPVLP